MKKIILLVLILTTFLNCSKTDDDTENLCSSNCTTLKGRIVTENDTPLKNIKLRLDYRISNAPFSASTRIIKETETDENGFYSMEFYLEDSEIGGNGQGYFALLIDESHLSPENYIRKNDIYIAEAIYSLPTRDTIINKSFYIPTKDFITVTLNNFLPLNSNDRFEVQTLYPSGLKIGQNDLIESQYASQSSGFGNYISINQVETFNNVIVARNEKNLITITKIKNGIATTENLLIFVPENNNINLTYEY
ncbi:hypothetical protein [Flavobacterium caseinilyticum]|uniref:Uncharacterized protein n=1 Tax=Flavobacterium caseinilyticum TaxID=2541732 RepID=A0A4R5AM23_9FLAO|nr:hypothetical protein [Flavobacterium caseinilyticum]TDD73791.1 hypothetical protein E0F89_16780 [Flavobacterium caseinilyticum]